MPATGVYGKSPRRMRIGTRSCAECRRRRVRCVFSPGAQTCDACVLHESPCRTQQPNDLERTDASTEGSVDLKRRIEELESVVNLLRETSSPSDAHSTSRISDLASKSTAASASDGSAPYHLPAQDDGDEAADGFDHAPLIALMKDAMVLESLDAKTNGTPVAQSAKVEEMMYNIRKTLPECSVLRSALVATQPYWSVWPPYFVGPSPADLLTRGQLDDVKTRIMGQMSSADPIVLVKALLWLTLCFQQVLAGCDRDESGPWAAAKGFVQRYLRSAQALLQAVDDCESSLAYVECLLFQYKLYINMGKPRKAWLCNRQALNGALLSGLYHLDKHSDDRKKCAWAEIWHSDVNLSLLLGFPAATSRSHPSLSRDLAPDIPGASLKHEIATIAAAIIERDQQSGPLDYATTLRIDQEWEQCFALVPEEWWSSTNSPNLSAIEIYTQQVTKLFLFLLRKHIHLPHMRMARTDRRYEYSRITGLDASRKLVQAYQGLRDGSAAEGVLCELMDFQAFSAGMTLVVDLFSHLETPNQQQEDEWNLVESLGYTLRHAAALMDCTIPTQAANVIERMLMAHQRCPEAPRRYVVIIPYFGKVQITCKSLTVTQPTSPELGELRPSMYSEEMDFAADLFDYELPPLLDFASELAVDWTSVLEWK